MSTAANDIIGTFNGTEIIWSQEHPILATHWPAPEPSFKRGTQEHDAPDLVGYIGGRHGIHGMKIEFENIMNRAHDVLQDTETQLLDIAHQAFKSDPWWKRIIKYFQKSKRDQELAPKNPWWKRLKRQTDCDAHLRILTFEWTPQFCWYILPTIEINTSMKEVAIYLWCLQIYISWDNIKKRRNLWTRSYKEPDPFPDNDTFKIKTNFNEKEPTADDLNSIVRHIIEQRGRM